MQLQIFKLSRTLEELMLLFVTNEPLSRLEPVRTSSNHQSVVLPKSQIPCVNPIKPVICPAGWAGWEVGRQDGGTNMQTSSQERQKLTSSIGLTTPVASLWDVCHWDSWKVLSQIQLSWRSREKCTHDPSSSNMSKTSWMSSVVFFHTWSASWRPMSADAWAATSPHRAAGTKTKRSDVNSTGADNGPNALIQAHHPDSFIIIIIKTFRITEQPWESMQTDKQTTQTIIPEMWRCGSTRTGQEEPSDWKIIWRVINGNPERWWMKSPLKPSPTPAKLLHL